MFLEGHIIEFLDTDQLRLGYVRKQDRDRLHVVDPRGRNLSVNGDRVVVVHERSNEGDFPTRAKDISERVSARQSDVDLELLWQSLGGSQREMAPGELAELFFSEASPHAVSAIFRALLDDTLFFRRKGSQFLAKTADQVSSELNRRTREREREAARGQITAVLTKLVREPDAAIPAGLDAVFERLETWMRYKTGDEVGAILEQVAGSARARDAAYDILTRAGRIDGRRDRFLAIAGVEEQFAGPVEGAAAKLIPFVHAGERTDFRGSDATTIDDEDTREVDDAVTIQQVDSEFLVGIHIADVSAFVEKGDVLDVEAARRSSTIYLPTTTVRMFPDRLSIDLASLRHGRDRPSFTVEVRFDGRFNQLGYRIALGSIQVGRRLSYDEADKLIEDDSGLRTLHTLAVHLQQARAARGAITFRRPELKIRVDDNRVSVKKIDPNAPSRILVSEMMILANGLAADFAAVNSLPVIFRTQEPREALAVEDAPAIEALAFERLRKTFKRSRLSLTPGLHSGLGLSAYTQASSPIRRYADLITQRQFTALLAGRPIPYTREELLQILASAEAAEQEVRSIEDRSTSYWLLRHLEEEKMNQPLSAVVLDQKNNIELADYYFRGKLTGPSGAAPGATIEVQIETVDPLKGEIRFKKI